LPVLGELTSLSNRGPEAIFVTIIYRTVTGTDVFVVGAVNPFTACTDTVVEPTLKGTNWVVILSEPPAIMTGDVIDPTAVLLEVTTMFADVPPASCSTAAKLPSGFN
jgi:hypothetical protein